MPGAGGKPMGVTVALDGREIILFNGGPTYHPTQGISFTVYCESEQEIDTAWKKLSEGGKVMMELAKYPWSEKYGWTNDKYGISWQFTLSDQAKGITPSMLYAGNVQGKAEEAINLYMSQFPHSKINLITRYESGEPGPEGKIKFGSFTLGGLEFIAMDSGVPMDNMFTPGNSIFVNCDTQQEVDKLWDSLAEGGRHDRCGWLQDRFGVSWQIIPTTLGRLMSDKDPAKAGRVMQAMLKMNKLSIQGLQDAYDGK